MDDHELRAALREALRVTGAPLNALKLFFVRYQHDTALHPAVIRALDQGTWPALLYDELHLPQRGD
jgi:hypothetical protein